MNDTFFTSNGCFESEFFSNKDHYFNGLDNYSQSL